MSHDPELTKTEGMLFELMRDGVIVSLVSNGTGSWLCTVVIPFDDQKKRNPSDEAQKHTFSSFTALGAYMAAFDFVITRKLEGKPIYCDWASRARRRLGLAD